MNISHSNVHLKKNDISEQSEYTVFLGKQR